MQCEKVPYLTLPEDHQPFCARMHRKGVTNCKDCDHGIQAAKEERNMPLIKKTCKCGKEYEGGPTARSCPECRAKAKESEGKKPASRRAAGTQRKSAPEKTADNGAAHESVKVLETLVAIGAITREQVDATRKYVSEMFS